VLDPATKKPFQNVNRWFTTVVNQPQFKAVVKDFKFCDKAAEFDAKKFQEFQGNYYFILEIVLNSFISHF